ncbi:hypothetical protein MPH_07126 [Macrophomina phaseolina MS6]|uniref:Uncharacterized protein n=1 Tax=Macrophomina phaseolina (strain MS6) TaxID=1126212 RepID=K2R0B7_MACPH|nr:hypothetical protein MPH_07126 [Macrophomina phaseolina MS6]
MCCVHSGSYLAISPEPALEAQEYHCSGHNISGMRPIASLGIGLGADFAKHAAMESVRWAPLEHMVQSSARKEEEVPDPFLTGVLNPCYFLVFEGSQWSEDKQCSKNMSSGNIRFGEMALCSVHPNVDRAFSPANHSVTFMNFQTCLKTCSKRPSEVTYIIEAASDHM